MKALDVTFRVLACPTSLSFSSLTLSLASLYSFCGSEAGFFPGLNLLFQAVGHLNMLFPVSGILFGSHFNILWSLYPVQMLHYLLSQWELLLPYCTFQS